MVVKGFELLKLLRRIFGGCAASDRGSKHNPACSGSLVFEIALPTLVVNLLLHSLGKLVKLTRLRLWKAIDVNGMFGNRLDRKRSAKQAFFNVNVLNVSPRNVLEAGSEESLPEDYDPLVGEYY